MDEEFNIENLKQYRKPIIIGCFVLLILCVVFLGFAYGSARVCDQVDGFLDDSFKCHLDYPPPVESHTSLEPQFNPVDWKVS